MSTRREKDRREIAHRCRRLIYNDDSDARIGSKSREVFLDSRFNVCLNTQVDSYFWCVGNGFEPPHNQSTAPELGDANQIMLEAARSAGMEIFASLRMNDTHDTMLPELFPPLKIQRPDLLVAEKKEYSVDGQSGGYHTAGAMDSILCLTWSAFDYAKEEVRKHFIGYIRDICKRYDWDGLELDFCRFRRYFKLGEEEQNKNIMTDFIKRVREVLDQIGAERLKPYLLAVRVPEIPEYSNRIGLDIESWLAGGYIDILIAGDGLKPFSLSLKEMIDLGHRYDVPVYPCLSASQFGPSNTGDSRIVERFRGAASNRWLDNPDGIYLFNVYVIGNKDTEKMILNELGEQRTLEGLDKIYMSEAFPHWIHWQYAISPYILPARLIDRTPLPLVIGDPVEGMALSGKVKELRLRIRVADIFDEENIEIRLNGKSVKIVTRSAATNLIFNINLKKIAVWEPPEGTWFEAIVGAPPLRRGMNEVRVGPSSGCWGKATTLVREIQLISTAIKE